MQLTSHDRSTLQMALTHWIIRCEEEAKIMRQFAKERPHHEAKCIANAEASERFAEDARALANSGRL